MRNDRNRCILGASDPSSRDGLLACQRHISEGVGRSTAGFVGLPAKPFPMVVVPNSMAMMPMVMVIVVIGEGGGRCGQRRHSDGEDHGDFFHRLALDRGKCARSSRATRYRFSAPMCRSRQTGIAKLHADGAARPPADGG